ncbi:gluconokinase [Streptomyces sp. Z26]|uniref:gluconokinase n=1 Tax=Streptomyces sp. Z26 TaxID=2500177 RepID=UPI000EF13A5B|nr:gluconokinase [Streptomyces sp. Z26]RLL70595.1 gluconokinase [Streptomyces sp. Z26]
MSVPRVVVVMGVSGTGKSTVGELVAEALGVPYAEADAFHPEANIAKMSAGTPLDDADRAPWLDAIGAWAADRTARGLGGVVSCSALKRRYRDRLRAADPALFFLHLDGSRELVAERLAGRRGHFMPRALLDSQFADLEPLEPDERGAALTIDAEPRTLAARAVALLGAPPEGGPEAGGAESGDTT